MRVVSQVVPRATAGSPGEGLVQAGRGQRSDHNLRSFLRGTWKIIILLRSVWG